jgi:hypothetical protein
MKNAFVSYAVLAFGIAGVSPALAQRLPFERTYEVSGPLTLDVSTIRGKIQVLPGDAGRVVVSGTVTVRLGLTPPADAVEIAKRIAKSPPVERDGGTLRLRPPAEPSEQRAVTVAYQVRVPAASTVRITSDSGATTVTGISGPVTVKTQSATIGLASLGGTASVTTGSGEVRIDGVEGALTVETSSSRIIARRIGSSLRLRTQSGAVEAGFVGTGDVDVETGSSAVRLIRVRGGATASSQSGRITIDGSPSRDWALKTGSSNVEVTLHPGAGARLEASSGSTNVSVQHPFFEGATDKGRASGTIGRGGPPVRITSRSGQIHVQGS